jgi:hypothetical protein
MAAARGQLDVVSIQNAELRMQNLQGRDQQNCREATNYAANARVVYPAMLLLSLSGLSKVSAL